MNYDQWKTMTPPEEPENECGYCGDPCEEEFCSKACRVANDND